MEKESLKVVLKLPPKRSRLSSVTSRETLSTDEEISENEIDQFSSGDEQTNLSEASNQNVSSSPNTNASVTNLPQKRKRKKRRFLFYSPTKSSRSRRSTANSLAGGEVTGSLETKMKNVQFSNNENEKGLKKDGNTKTVFKVPESRPRQLFNLSKFTPFQLFLDYFVRTIAAKDPEGYFAKSFSPSEIEAKNLPQPFLHFGSIREKIAKDAYKNLMELKADMELMVCNVLKFFDYSAEYRVAGRKFVAVIDYMFSKEKMLSLQRTLPLVKKVTMEQLSFEAPKVSNVRKAKPNRHPMIIDDVTPEELLLQANAICDRANSMSKNKETFAFPKFNLESSFTLKMFTPESIYDEDDMCQPTRPLLIGDLVKKLDDGTSDFVLHQPEPLTGVPVTFLSYGPYASFAPTYDSTFATFNKEESLFLLSEQRRRHENVDASLASVRKILHIDYDDGHVNIANFFMQPGAKQKQKTTATTPSAELDKNGEKPSAPIKPLVSEAEFNSLKSLESFDIDMSFLDEFADPKLLQEKQGPKSISDLLNENSKFIKTVIREQNARFSKPLPANSDKLPGPSEEELKATGKLLSNLTALIAEVPPGALSGDREIEECLARRMADGSLTDALTEEDENGEYDMNLLREFMQVDS